MEQIQDKVINLLKDGSLENNLEADQMTAGVYAAYRTAHMEARAQKDALTKVIEEKLEATNVENANANLDEHSFSGRMGEARNAITKDFALNHVMSKLARDNHVNNEIYTHDLDSYAVGMHNCLSVPFDDLLKNGVWVRTTFLRPARSVSTACQLVAVIFQLQSQCQFGGVSATHLDWTMVPFVRISFYKHFKEAYEFLYDGKKLPEGINEELSIDDFAYKAEEKVYNQAYKATKKEVYQAVEGMYHNLNSLQSRSGGQLPFTSINYGTCTLPEGRMFIEALLRQSIRGVGILHMINGEEQGQTAIFPCGIFQMKKGVNRKPGEPNYDLYQLALKSTAKRLYPNYANCDWSGNEGYDPNDPRTYFSTMGCRTANGKDINADPDVNVQTKDGRGNICPVTIIMPTIAMMAKEVAEKNGTNVKDEFITLLDRKIHEAKDQLIERYEHICAQPASAAQFMWQNHTMLGYDGKTTRSALRHGTLAIGQLGLAETLQILMGCDQTDKEGMAFAKKIEGLFKTRCAEFKQEEHLNFGVYYTPAENLCFTAMKKFKEKYGEIENVSDKKFFTNSIHVPVWKEVSPFEKIDIESQLTGYSSAGCITYVELDSAASKNLKALEVIVNYAMDHDIPYFAINVPNDQCLDCGFTGEFNDECPVCHSKHILQLRRVTGYLTGNFTTAFNEGKQQEVHLRYQHSKQMRKIIPSGV